MSQRNHRDALGRSAPIGRRTGQSLPPGAGVDELLSLAVERRRAGDIKQAERLCRAILTRSPRHTEAQVLLGELLQQDGRSAAAVRVLKQALAADPGHSLAHDTIAVAYQTQGRKDAALSHFIEAINLGLSGVETVVKQSLTTMGKLGRLAGAWSRQVPLAEFLAAGRAGALADDTMLLALLQSRPVCDFELERFFTALRRALLQFVSDGIPSKVEDGLLAVSVALAQQCFINEYVFPLSQDERAQSQQLRDRIVQQLCAGAAIEPLQLAAAGCYLPLNTLPSAAALLDRPWPEVFAPLLKQQLREPQQEEMELAEVPTLTPVDDAVSREVQDQYEENPYPRWTKQQPVPASTIGEYFRVRLAALPPDLSGLPAAPDILVAGCGTGSHSIETAQRFPRARILAIDVSRRSLAYARRKTREAGIGNIEYAQADILGLERLNQRFDIIESVGVLHHLSDPLRGWRILASLLRPGGLMLIGLYSAAARRNVNAARAVIAERGYRTTAEDIRAWRQELIARGLAIPSQDFFSISGCRDMCFNVMEHQFTVPQIEASLAECGLTFLGFEVPPEVHEQFGRLFPAPDAATNLARWAEFEERYPRTFARMYNFWIRKPPTS